jgi:hypothetical protein
LYREVGNGDEEGIFVGGDELAFEEETFDIA